MGIFDLFKKKKVVSQETQRQFLDNILIKYFDGSKEKLQKDAIELLELTKYGINLSQMIALLMRCLGLRELKGVWNKQVLETLRKDSSGLLPDKELKWLLVYCDVHYIKKDSSKEVRLIAELGGRQIGMPSPLGDLSANYEFDK